MKVKIGYLVKMRFAILGLLLGFACVAFGQNADSVVNGFWHGQKVYKYAKTMPKFPGDINKYLADHLIYPDAARDSGFSDRMIFQFIVDTFGKCRDVRIIRGHFSAETDKTWTKMFTDMPPWIPGRLENNRKVPVLFTVPLIIFLE